jgi:hypothetical protein
MDDDAAVRDLMARLMDAVQASLQSSVPVRDALAELTRNGYEARLFFVANAETPEASDETEGPGDGDPQARVDEAETGDEEPSPLVFHEVGTPADDDLSAELTKLDREFLRSLNIRPEAG